MRGNRFTELPAWLGDLTNLTVLDLGTCRLGAVPGWVRGLGQLTTLRLNSNRLTELLSRTDDEDPVPAARAANEADDRTLLAMLTKLDPGRSWGGPSRTMTPEGLTLYLCAEHVAGYRQPATG